MCVGGKERVMRQEALEIENMKRPLNHQASWKWLLSLNFPLCFALQMKSPTHFSNSPRGWEVPCQGRDSPTIHACKNDHVLGVEKCDSKEDYVSFMIKSLRMWFKWQKKKNKDWVVKKFWKMFEGQTYKAGRKKLESMREQCICLVPRMDSTQNTPR